MIVSPIPDPEEFLINDDFLELHILHVLFIIFLLFFATVSKNNRKMIKSTCKICNSKKSSFIKNSSGSGIGDTIIKAVGKIGELHLPAEKGEYVPNGFFNNLKKALLLWTWHKI